MREESEREIRERIEATRARMGDTIEEIGDRVNPDRVQRELKARAREQVDDFKHTVKQKARDTMSDMGDEVTERGRSLWETIKENPIPAGMVGVGLAWLVANGRSQDDDRYDRSARRAAGGYRGYPDRPGDAGYRGYPETASVGYRAGYMGATGGEVHARGGGMGAGLDRSVPLDRQYEGREEGSGVAERVKEGAQEAAERVRETAEHAAESAREKGSELVDRASEGIDEARHQVEHWADEAQDRARRAERRVEDAVREHPMAAGMIAAALGFAAGLMIPETDREHELMGPTRDRMLDRAQETARHAADKAKDVAKETASASAERAVDEMWPGGESSERSGINDPGR
jgi:ElaB/YqjD/DUF883 family membrane-anchored ribosome-binding protein